ncbi:MAG TPA: hypothetical protein VFZ34_11930 [Blastocatellia bacterium]|nr:hypothetical protein [Blastocatellia bacterium]
MQKTIRTCEVKFRKKCPQLWDDLKATENEAVRFCEECSKNVYYAKTDEEALNFAEQGYCIAKERIIGQQKKMVLGKPRKPMSRQAIEEMERVRLDSNKDIALSNIQYTEMRCSECGYPIFPRWRKNCLVCGTIVSGEKA